MFCCGKKVLFPFLLLLYVVNGQQCYRNIFQKKSLKCYTFANICYLNCVICENDYFAAAISNEDYETYCDNLSISDENKVISFVSNSIFNISKLHGEYWLDDGGVESNRTEALQYLLRYMPIRDIMLLNSSPHLFIDYMFENLRYALLAYHSWSKKFDISFQMFVNYILPYSVLNEKRDIHQRWRPQFYQLFSPLVSSVSNITQAVHILATAIPTAQFQGILSMVTNSGEELLNPGNPITWHSESSPARLSTIQVVKFGGSCTGTAIVLANALRSVGIPCRITGCTQSIPNDDHHWVEFYDPSDDGPFKDYWHTKEGTSKGNSGGPWDQPSLPMLGCLRKLIPQSELNTIWSVSYNSSVNLPTLWTNSNWFAANDHVGGLNVCGRYCSAWGCGANNTHKYTQHQCYETI